MNYYRWQKDCLRAWEDHDYQGIVNVVTGAGKTVFALAAIKLLQERYEKVRVRIVVPFIPLAQQWQRALLHDTPSPSLRPGFFGGGVHDDPDRPVTIYIVNTARSALPAHVRRDLALGCHVLLICDECHHMQSRENRKIFSFLNQDARKSGLYHCLGLSATPFDTPNDGVLRAALGPEIYRYDYSSAVAEDVVSPFTVCEISASFCAEEREEYNRLSEEVSMLLARVYQTYPQLEHITQSAFLKAVMKYASAADMDPSDPAAAFLIATWQRKKISNLAQARIQCALSLLSLLPRQERVLLFCERIEQAENLRRQICRRFGGSCAIYHSSLSKEARARNLNAFRNGETRFLVSCRCLDEGIDVPDAAIGIVLSSSSIPRQRTQRLGRLVRRSAGKDAACLYYIYIRESTDDSAYLPQLKDMPSFHMNYFTAEDTFSNELYEYVASALLQRAKNAPLREKSLSELRRCLLEGLVRADYLLPDAVQEQNRSSAKTVHEKNYWRTMQRVGTYFAHAESV